MTIAVVHQLPQIAGMLAGEQLEVHQPIGQGGHVAQQFGRDDGGVEHAVQLGAPFGGGAGGLAVEEAVDRVVHQETRAASAVLHQHHGLGQRGLAAVDGAFDGGAAQRLAAHVQPPGREVVAQWLHITDDVAFRQDAGREFVDGKTGAVLRVHAGLVPGHVGQGHTLDQAQPADTGERLPQVERVDEGAEFRQLQGAAARLQASGALQREQGQPEALAHLLVDALGMALEPLLRLLPVVAGHRGSHHQADHNAHHRHQCLGPGATPAGGAGHRGARVETPIKVCRGVC